MPFLRNQLQVDYKINLWFNPTMSNTSKTAIEQVLDLISVSRLALACDVSKQAIYKWIKQGYPPAERCPEIEEAVGGRVSRFDLLPPPFHKPKRRRKTNKQPAPQPQ